MLPRTTKDEAMQLNVRMPPDELKSVCTENLIRVDEVAESPKLAQ
jgi:hypothetical protein